MKTSITERALLLISKTNLDDLSRAGDTGYVRWQNIKRERARVGAEEIEILGNIYPQYAYWLTTGNIMPESGQTSPEFDELARLEKPQKSGTHD
ncbi:MAG: hypothetical protein Q7S87_12840 [Agitococcus sp.]|nr:hypothetical protein [Agitococcus sp.]